jgi:hypothetical protein
MCFDANSGWWGAFGDVPLRDRGGFERQDGTKISDEQMASLP